MKQHQDYKTNCGIGTKRSKYWQHYWELFKNLKIGKKFVHLEKSQVFQECKFIRFFSLGFLKWLRTEILYTFTFGESGPVWWDHWCPGNKHHTELNTEVSWQRPNGGWLVFIQFLSSFLSVFLCAEAYSAIWQCKQLYHEAGWHSKFKPCSLFYPWCCWGYLSAWALLNNVKIDYSLSEICSSLHHLVVLFDLAPKTVLNSVINNLYPRN